MVGFDRTCSVSLRFRHTLTHTDDHSFARRLIEYTEQGVKTLSTSRLRHLFGEVQVIVQPLPRLHLRHTQTRSTVGERREEKESPDQSRDDNARSSPRSQERLASHALPDWLVARLLGDYLAILRGVGNIGGLEVEDEFDQGTSYQSTSKLCWEVVMQEELTAHDEERDVVSSPSQEEESGAVVQARASPWQGLAHDQCFKWEITYACRVRPRRDEC